MPRAAGPIGRTLARAAVAAVLFSTLGASAPADKASPVEIRVLVFEKQTKLELAARGPYLIRALDSGAVLARGEKLSGLVVTAPGRGGIGLGRKVVAQSGIRIETTGARDLYLNHYQFRGVLDIRRDGTDPTLSAVNRLDLESYLYGVLPHEVAFWWPMEALKAQAVAARTYALYQISVSRRQEYDVKNTTSSQVYGGTARERYRTNRAVELTRGEHLTHAGKIFPAYFHATCAGRTAAASELWNIDVPPLAGGALCEYCRISPHYYWQARIPLSQVEEKLAASGRAVGQLMRIEPVTRTPSGRVGTLRFVGTKGQSTVAAKDFRVWMGGSRIRSTSFTLTVKDDAAEFRGQGWGHGVGLCQWGALGQALLGRPYAQILSFYYPGSESRRS